MSFDRNFINYSESIAWFGLISKVKSVCQYTSILHFIADANVTMNATKKICLHTIWYMKLDWLVVHRSAKWDGKDLPFSALNILQWKISSATTLTSLFFCNVVRVHKNRKKSPTLRCTSVSFKMFRFFFYVIRLLYRLQFSRKHFALCFVTKSIFIDFAHITHAKNRVCFHLTR